MNRYWKLSTYQEIFVSIWSKFIFRSIIISNAFSLISTFNPVLLRFFVTFVKFLKTEQEILRQDVNQLVEIILKKFNLRFKFVRRQKQ